MWIGGVKVSLIGLAGCGVGWRCQSQPSGVVVFGCGVVERCRLRARGVLNVQSAFSRDHGVGELPIGVLDAWRRRRYRLSLHHVVVERPYYNQV